MPYHGEGVDHPLDISTARTDLDAIRNCINIHGICVDCRMAD